MYNRISISISYYLVAIICVIAPFKLYAQEDLKYPTLFDCGVRVEKFPPGFGFITNKLLKKIYLTESLTSVNNYSNSIGYSRRLATDETIAIPIAQTGMRLIIYPQPSKKTTLRINFDIDYQMIGLWDDEFGKSASPNDVPKDVRKHYVPLVRYFRLHEDSSVALIEALLKSVPVKNENEKINYIVSQINNHFKYSALEIDATKMDKGDFYSFTNLNLIKEQINENALFKGIEMEYGDVIYYAFIENGKNGKKIVDQIARIINRDRGVRGDSYQLLRNLLVPTASGIATIHQLAIEIPRDILIPLDTNYFIEKSVKTKTMVNFDPLSMLFYYNYDDDRKLQFRFFNEESCYFSNPIFQIGNTGFMLNFTKAYLLDLPGFLNYDPICANESTMLYMKSVTVGLPIKYFGKDKNGKAFTIQGSKFSIGKEGVCGLIEMEEDEIKNVKFEGIDFELNKCSIFFENNEIKMANIEGVLKFPDKNVDITIYVSKNGKMTYRRKTI